MTDRTSASREQVHPGTGTQITDPRGDHHDNVSRRERGRACCLGQHRRPESMRTKLKDALFRLGTGIHRALFSISKGRIFGTVLRMPVVKLVTTGRTSGKERTTMLTVPIVDGERLVLVASFGGDDRHPAWYRNLQANPEVRVTMTGSTRSMVARVASDEEKAQLWPRIVATARCTPATSRRPNGQSRWSSSTRDSRAVSRQQPAIEPGVGTRPHLVGEAVAARIDAQVKALAAVSGDVRWARYVERIVQPVDRKDAIGRRR